MTGDGDAVDPELAAAVASYVDGARVNVRGKSVELGISRATFYNYVDRFRERGVDGLFPDSRRPRHSPSRLDPGLEDVLIAVRKREAGAGWDYGADAVLMRLAEEPELWPAGVPLPARATVNRVFDARGQLTKMPQRKPRPRYRRFERDRVNELWQYDGFEVSMAGDRTAVVLQLSDDCSRVFTGLGAAVSENAADVWDTFCAAGQGYGLPAAVLSDNGTAFSGRRRGWTSRFEANLSTLGIEAITSRPQHPQTCGKSERGHGRVLKWLAQQPPPEDLAALQQMLDYYRDRFNDRGNQVLGGLSPHQRFALGPCAGPAGEPLAPASHVTGHTVTGRGAIGVDGTLIGLGRAHAGRPATAFRSGDHVTVFVGDQLIRQLTIDRARRYQPQER
jgi:transposase InsO family protein